MTGEAATLREGLERLRRRVGRLEAEATLLRVEIDALARLVEAPAPALPPELREGRALDVGLDWLFTGGDLDPTRRVAPYEKVTERFWFGFEDGDRAPDIRLWQAQPSVTEPGAEARRALVVDLRDRRGAEWLLMEFALDWSAIGEERRLALATRGRSDPPARFTACLYAEDGEGQPLRTDWAELSQGATLSIAVATLTLDADFAARADRGRPPKLHVGFPDIARGRLELEDMRLIAPAA